MTKKINLEEIKNLQKNLTDAKGGVIKSRSKAAKMLIEEMKGTETTEDGKDYIIVADGQVVTLEEAKLILEDINTKNQSPEERTYQITQRYMETTVKDYYDRDIANELNSSPWITLWDSYQKFLAKSIPLFKFADATAKANNLLGTTGVIQNPYDMMVNEATEISKDRIKKAPVKTGIRQGEDINKKSEDKLTKGTPNKFQTKYDSVEIKNGIDAWDWIRKVFITEGKFIVDTRAFYTTKSRHFLQIIDNTGVNKNYIIRCNIGSKNNKDDSPEINIEDVSYEEEISVVAGKNKRTQAGHFYGGKMQKSNLANKKKFLEEILETGKNPFSGEPLKGLTGWEGIGKVQAFLNNYEEAEAIDKISGSYSLETLLASNKSPGKTVLDPFIQEARKLGAKEILVVETKTIDGVLVAGKREVKTTYEYTTEVVWWAEYARFNSIKGGTQNSRIDNAEKAFLEIMKSLLAEGGVYTEDSPSMFSELVMASLIDILDPLLDKLTKKQLVDTLLNKRKSTKRVFYKHKLTKPKGLIDLDKLRVLVEKDREQVLRDFKKIQSGLEKAVSKEEKIAKSKRKIRKLVNKYNPSVSSNFNSLSIIEALNSTLREDVINEMSSNTLVNRTGKFASSARVVDANIPDSVGFTYKPSPYRVFSTAHGGPPWNSNPDRDPGSIIRQAIKRSMDKRFPGVFRPTVKVLER